MPVTIAALLKLLNFSWLLTFAVSMISMVFPKLGASLLSAMQGVFPSSDDHFDSLAKQMTSTQSPTSTTSSFLSKDATASVSQQAKHISASSLSHSKSQQSQSGLDSNCTSYCYCCFERNSHQFNTTNTMYAAASSSAVECCEYSCTSVARSVIQQQNERYQQHLKLKAKLKKNSKNPIGITAALSSFNNVCTNLEYIQCSDSSFSSSNDSCSATLHEQGIHTISNGIDQTDLSETALTYNSIDQQRFNYDDCDTEAQQEVAGDNSSFIPESIPDLIPFQDEGDRCSSSESRMDKNACCDYENIIDDRLMYVSENDQAANAEVKGQNERMHTQSEKEKKRVSLRATYESKLKRKNRQVLRGGAAEQYYVDANFALIKRINTQEDLHSQLENSCFVRKCPCLKFKRKHAMRGQPTPATAGFSPSHRLPTIFENVAY